MKPGPRNGRLIRGSRQVGGGPGSSTNPYAQYGDLIADYNPVNATASGGRVTLVTEPISGYNAAPNVAGAGPTLTASDAAYANKPVFTYASSNPAGSDRLVTTAGLGVAMGSNEVTIVLAGHTTSPGKTSQYELVHNNGRFGYLNKGTDRRMYGSVNDIPTSRDGSVPGVFGGVFLANGNGRHKFNAFPIATVLSLGAPANSGAFYIGNYAIPDDSLVLEGVIARILIYVGDIGDVNLAAVVGAVSAEYGL